MTTRKRPLAALIVGAVCVAAASVAHAAVDKYLVDPGHTYPAFEADHLGGLSIWRGKINKTKGTVTLDRVNKTGTVNIEMDASTIDFGHSKMNEEAKGVDMFDVEAYPTIEYVGKSMRFEGDKPVEVLGELTLKGVTKPVNLTIKQFKCINHPFKKVEVCGADAEANFKRTDFNLGYAVDRGFLPEVKVRISIEAVKQP
ncbi:YceI family protein [Limnobacter humi]|uniref:YceI family protein n=1 Tax=Limnobacter humi TaxID=1778671 RepID=A0ABT1WDT7_9BURK|nr:YceI family protein [Limnobacter humi]MCQ8895675.1 YceI family protein [Limnobacter humi]